MVLPGRPAYAGLREPVAALVVALGLSLLTGCGAAPDVASGPVASGPVAAPSNRPGPADTWSTQRLTHPDRVRVLGADGEVLATFTAGARTVAVHGPLRVFAEPATTSATVHSRTWVRLLPAPFDGHVDRGWLSHALQDTSPDVLAIALQYVTGAPPVRDRHGRVIAGDADFGRLLANGNRAEGSDFNDFLGIRWSYGGTVDPPEPRERGALDCSGFLRMVFGYRSGFPLTLGPSRTSLPRVAIVMMMHGPGVVIEPNRGVTPSVSRLQPGDLLFFDNTLTDPVPLSHSGIYLGRDTQGRPRFVSSRKVANGPTMGDAGGVALLTGTGFNAVRWRAARRI
jgi:hypothetical protein